MSDLNNPWPGPSLFPKQQHLFNLGTTDARDQHPDSPPTILVDGPRKSSKTIGVGHRVVRHLWETPEARFALVSKSIKNLNDAGVLQELVNVILPEWMDSGIGMRYTTRDRKNSYGPVVDTKTRSIYLRVTNYYGGQSELRLLSINHDDEVAKIIKNTNWSGFWFSELSEFKDPKILTTSRPCLRMFHLKPWQHLWIADTNPAKEGERHWAYIRWYLRKPVEGQSDEDLKSLSSYKLVHFDLKDNLSLTPGMINDMRLLYADDPGELAREFEGRWVAGHGGRGKHFADIFQPGFHVIGERGKPDNDQINISESSDELQIGLDIGTINHAAVIHERLPIIGNDNVEYSQWNVLDDLLYLGEHRTVGEFTIELIQKVEAIEKEYGRKFDLTLFLDDSAFTVWHPSGEHYDYLEMQIAAASYGRPLVNMIPVRKPEGSRETRVRLVRRLLRTNRIWISARAENVQQSLEGCYEGGRGGDYIEPRDLRHIFDALSYPLLVRCGYELELAAGKPSAHKTPEPSRMVSI